MMSRITEHAAATWATLFVTKYPQYGKLNPIVMITPGHRRRRAI